MSATGKPRRRGVVYISHIPHGFYEKQMQQFFTQFGSVTNLRLFVWIRMNWKWVRHLQRKAKKPLSKKLFIVKGFLGPRRSNRNLWLTNHIFFFLNLFTIKDCLCPKLWMLWTAFFFLIACLTPYHCNMKHTACFTQIIKNPFTLRYLFKTVAQNTVRIQKINF